MKEKALNRLKELAKDRQKLLYEIVESEKEGSKVRVNYDMEGINANINMVISVLLDELCKED